VAITKQQLVKRIAESTGSQQRLVKTVVQEFLDEITAELANDNRLEFRDFGVFEVHKRAARMAQNPKTLEPVPVSSKRFVKFRMGRKTLERLNEGAPHE
jgi:nucleoid DNA-binding protein